MCAEKNLKSIPAVYDTLIFCDVLVTQNADRHILTEAAIAICEGVIVALGTKKEFKNSTAKQVLNLKNCLVMPGLVNAHTHVAMTFLRGAADDIPLMKWLTEHIFPVEKELTAEIVYWATQLGCAEMMRTGTTCFQDMYLFASAVFEATKKAGLRAVIGKALFSFPSPAYAHQDVAFSLLEKLVHQAQQTPLLKIGIMPHSVYTTTPALLREAVTFAKKHRLVQHIHLAETKEEVTACLEKTGMRPVGYCEDLGVFEVPTSIAHGVYVTQEECKSLAQSHVSVAHCPQSNMKLASGIAPFNIYEKSGVPIALGTDGAASNNMLNMFGAMNTCALVHKGANLNPEVASAQFVLDAATLGGGKALGWEGLGCLEVGGVADLIALDLREPNMQPMYAPASQLVYATTGLEVCLTMVGGNIVYDCGKYTTLDYPLVQKEMQKIKKWVLQKRK